MMENVVGILFLLVGALMVAAAWLFVDVNQQKHQLRDLELERKISNDSGRELWKVIEKCEGRIAEMDVFIHEKLATMEGTKVREDAHGEGAVSR